MPRTFALLATAFWATAAAADTVIDDDLIVIGSACLGADCFNDLPFGDDQLVFRENNTRISFGSYQQFRLTANSTSFGGPEEFRIDSFRTVIFLTDEAAIMAAGTFNLPGATVRADGSLIVPITSPISGLLSFPSVFEESATTVSSGQTLIFPPGSFTETSPGVFNLVSGTPVTSTSPSGGVNGEVASGAVSLVAFSDDGNMVTLGIGSAGVAGAVSVGGATVPRQITGVADAVADDDVINLGQLTAAFSNPVLDLTDQIQSEASRLDGVSATTAAMSALQPNPRAQAPLSISLGLGTYEGETAAAMGVLWRMSDTSHLQFSIAGSEETTPQTAVSFRIVW